MRPTLLNSSELPGSGGGARCAAYVLVPQTLVGAPPGHRGSLPGNLMRELKQAARCGIGVSKRGSSE